MSFNLLREHSHALLHDRLGVPANYYVTHDADPVQIRVRIHPEGIRSGAASGSSDFVVEKEEGLPEVIFLESEVPAPARNARVVISAREGYRIGQTKPVEGCTISAQATRLTKAELEGVSPPAMDHV